MERQWLLVLVLLLIGKARSNPWYFGEDNPNFRVIYQVTGQIWPFHYNTRVIITIPPCMTLKYVSVAVYNAVSIPTVKFHSSISTVSITYGKLQLTKSGYDIVAKGYRTKGCTPGIKEDNGDYIPNLLKAPAMMDGTKSKAQIVKLSGKKSKFEREGNDYVEESDDVESYNSTGPNDYVL